MRFHPAVALCESPAACRPRYVTLRRVFEQGRPGVHARSPQSGTRPVLEHGSAGPGKPPTPPSPRRVAPASRQCTGRVGWQWRLASARAKCPCCGEPVDALAKRQCHRPRLLWYNCASVWGRGWAPARLINNFRRPHELVVVCNKDMDELNAYHLQRLQWSLQALARPAREQLSLYPDFVCPGDELVLEFDEQYRAVRSLPDLERDQREALAALDDFLDKHSGERYQRMYMEPVGLDEPEWAEIRSLAKAALESFDWKDELPPEDRGDTYVK